MHYQTILIHRFQIQCNNKERVWVKAGVLIYPSALNPCCMCNTGDVRIFSAVQQSSLKSDICLNCRGNKWTLCKPWFIPFLFSHSRDEGSTLPAALLWSQEGHAAVRSHCLCCLLEDLSKTAQKNQKMLKKKHSSAITSRLKQNQKRKNEATSWLNPGHRTTDKRNKIK